MPYNCLTNNVRKNVFIKKRTTFLITVDEALLLAIVNRPLDY